MRSELAVDEIKLTLPELLDSLAPGDEVVLTRDHLPVARLVNGSHSARQPRKPGNCQGMITLLVEDDDHLAGFFDPSLTP